MWGLFLADKMRKTPDASAMVQPSCGLGECVTQWLTGAHSAGNGKQRTGQGK